MSFWRPFVLKSTAYFESLSKGSLSLLGLVITDHFCPVQTGCLSSGVKDLQQQHPRLEAALLQWNAHHHQHCPHHLKCSSHHHDHDASGWFVTWAAARESFRWKTCSGLIGHQCIKPQLLRCYIWTVLSILQHYAIKFGSQWMLLRCAVESIEVQLDGCNQNPTGISFTQQSKGP